MTSRTQQKYETTGAIYELLKKHFAQNPDRVEITALTLARQLCNRLSLEDLHEWEANLVRVTERDEAEGKS